MSKLTRKQTIFVNEYLIDYNATRAAKAAKYSERTAHTMGSELLTKPEVQAFIEKELEARRKASQITAAQIEAEFAVIAFLKPEDFILWQGRYAIQVKLADKIKCLEALARMKGLFKDKNFSFKDLSKEEIKALVMEWVETNERPKLTETT